MQSRRKREEQVLRDGEITALVVRRSQDERVVVHLDGCRAFDLSAVVADRAALRAGVVLSAERQRDLIDEDAPYRARERALRLLALREHSRREIEVRLRQAEFDAGVIAQTLEWLTGLGYLDDRRFAAVYAAEKQRGGWGPRRIRSELAAKGVERGVADEVLAPLEAGGDDAGSGGGIAGTLEQTVRRRFGRQFATDPTAAERRLAGFLARRGYDWEVVGRMVKLMRSEAGSDPENPSIP